MFPKQNLVILIMVVQLVTIPSRCEVASCRYCMRLHVMQHSVLPRPFCPSVYLSNAWIVTKRKKLVPTFLYHIKDRSS